MPRTIYSKRLWSQPPTVAAGTVSGPAVPQGFVWDIRDIIALNTVEEDGTLVPALTIFLSGPINIFRTPPRVSVTGVTYHEELRFIVYSSDVLEASSAGAGWGWSITGYELVA